MADTWTRRLYDKASLALDEAHRACFNSPDRGAVGMSAGPFSGVNKALGIIAELEQFKDQYDALIAAGWVLTPPAADAQ